MNSSSIKFLVRYQSESSVTSKRKLRERELEFNQNFCSTVELDQRLGFEDNGDVSIYIASSSRKGLVGGTFIEKRAAANEWRSFIPASQPRLTKLRRNYCRDSEPPGRAILKDSQPRQDGREKRETERRRRRRGTTCREGKDKYRDKDKENTSFLRCFRVHITPESGTLIFMAVEKNITPTLLPFVISRRANSARMPKY